jgi:hypothetical protein
MILSVASTALSCAALWDNVKIVARKWVTPFTVCPKAGNPNAGTAHVFPASDYLHMRGITAERDPTKVIKFESFWNLANKDLVNGAMSQDKLPVDPDPTITFHSASKPNPASSLSIHADFIAKSLREVVYAGGSI